MTDIPYSYLRLNRLRIMARGNAVYDQKFHSGVNIIRGDNGSGKSTIADFIFFVLGGDLKGWKKAAEICDEVQAEISTPRGTLTLRREKVEGRPPVWVFFGGIEDAAKHGVDGWEKYPIQRVKSNVSFTEVLFRSMLVPEAQSDGASNITIHQMLRLLYSDQRTPAPRLFRFEQFDKQTIRVAVGDLLCGISDYKLFEVELEIRELCTKFIKIDNEWSSLLRSFPDQQEISVDAISLEISRLKKETEELEKQIETVDEAVTNQQSDEFNSNRRKALVDLKKRRAQTSKLTLTIESSELEYLEISRFLEHLRESLVLLHSAEKTSEQFGEIQFVHCPACLKEIVDSRDPTKCSVCGEPWDEEHIASRYNQIRLDIELQIKESEQLLTQEAAIVTQANKTYTKARGEYEKVYRNFAVLYEMSSSPRESYLASRYRSLGRNEKAIDQFKRSLQRADEMDRLSQEKKTVNGLLTSAKDRRKNLERTVAERRRSALKLVSNYASSILHADISGAQEEFATAEHVDLSFGDDAILVDGQVNFAESGNVFLKNAAILSLFLAASKDKQFFHPRFALFDNIEDKGMQPNRSHKFQELIVKLSTDMPIENQIIFTTSMMNPALELEDYVVGPYYDEFNKSLQLAKKTNPEGGS